MAFDLFHSIISNELHSLFYIMSAILIHLVLTPIFIYKEYQRRSLFRPYFNRTNLFVLEI